MNLSFLDELKIRAFFTTQNMPVLEIQKVEKGDFINPYNEPYYLVVHKKDFYIETRDFMEKNEWTHLLPKTIVLNKGLENHLKEETCPYNKNLAENYKEFVQKMNPVKNFYNKIQTKIQEQIKKHIDKDNGIEM